MIDREAFFYHVYFQSVLDASGNYAGGFLYGQNFRPANPNQCYRLNDELNYFIAQDNVDGLLNTTSIVPFFVQLVSAKYVTYVDNSVTATKISSQASLKLTNFF